MEEGTRNIYINASHYNSLPDGGLKSLRNTHLMHTEPSCLCVLLDVGLGSTHIQHSIPNAMHTSLVKLHTRNHTLHEEAIF